VSISKSYLVEWSVKITKLFRIRELQAFNPLGRPFSFDAEERERVDMALNLENPQRGL
jgi:hypothetical protein